MKKKLLGLALLGAMMATLLVGCGSSGGKKGDTKDDVITIGFSQVGAESDWRTANSESMKSTFTKDNGYELAMEVPGFDKEDLKLDLEDGYLTVSAEHNKTNEEKDNEGHLIRQERYYGNTKRSFYVGDAVTKEDIQAKYDKGILNIFVPKKEVKKIEDKQLIEIQ